ncbi:MAG TPA: FAD-binding oxidoreductase [Aggregatilineales bacterium]|nr:FAD-binding oxidoreductase [Aggregatilineales bacterium]
MNAQRTSDKTLEESPTPALTETMRARRYDSWGRYPTSTPKRIIAPHWQTDIPDLRGLEMGETVLPHGYGRSYGDSCLNNGGTLIDMTRLRRYIAFDEESGLLQCEAGVMLADILATFVPRGWFLPVTPGTKFVSIGGAIANDVHGKNHHGGGTFGCHVTRFELLRSDGSRLLCSPTENANYFRATIGGLGLTGLILWAEFRLRRIPGPYIAEERIKFRTIEEYFEIARDSDERFEYTAAWLDCLTFQRTGGRGFTMLGNHDRLQPLAGKALKAKNLPALPIDAPSFALNPLTMLAFNEVIYRMPPVKHLRRVVPYDGFFYPLDAIGDWNRMYGARGFLQHQFVVPYNDDYRALKTILNAIGKSGEGSFLVVLKTFGERKSPGMLSFPQPGVTLALDFPMRGESTLKLLDHLDSIVREVGGVVYPAKDARMSAANFQAFYPQWQTFATYVDPAFSSTFWRRVTAAV